MKGISRVLIANRSEIALRVIRACREMGIESVAAVSEADRESLPAKMADRTVCISPPPPTESYLKVGTIITDALGTGADAIHPGYGFLAEQPDLPEACTEYGLTFIGPTADNIRKMGDKLWARKMGKEQLRVAAGDALSFSQEEVQLNGHAIECRINAESPKADFRPCPGRITRWVPPEGPGIRVDSHCYAGYFVPPYYDSLLAKLITKGSDRSEAIERMQYALESFIVSGIDTTIPFHQVILKNPDYVDG